MKGIGKKNYNSSTTSSPLLATKTNSINIDKPFLMGLFFIYYRLFEQTLQVLQQINVKMFI